MNSAQAMDIDSARAAVARAYRAVLGREADAAGLTEWCILLATGQLNIAGVIRNLFNSQEFGERWRSDVAAVAAPADVVRQGYRMVLGREADLPGLLRFETMLNTGEIDGAAMVAELSHSPEFEDRWIDGFADMEPEPPPAPPPPPPPVTEAVADFVLQHAYTTILLREPDEEGFAAHRHRLVSGKIDLDALLGEFTSSPERLVREAERRAAAKHRAARSLSLSQTYGAPAGSWTEFVNAALPPPLVDGNGWSVAGCRRVHISIDRSGRLDRDVLRTLRSLIALELPGGATLAATLFREDGTADVAWPSTGGIGYRALPTLLPTLPDRGEFGPADWVIWLGAGDEIHPRAIDLLARSAEPTTAFVSFDGSYAVDDEVFPVLHPGTNLALALNADLMYSRLACRPAVLPDAFVTTAPRGRDRLSDWLSFNGHLRAWQHMALPIIDLALTPETIQDYRECLVVNSSGYRSPATGRDLTNARISIVICTKDNGNLLYQLVTSILNAATDRLVDIIIVANNTASFVAEQSFDRLTSRSSLVKIIRYDDRFNFSAQSNIGTRNTSGDFVVMLNDDVTPVSDNWLDALLEPFADPAVGITGPLLLYPNEQIQHAGMFMGFGGSAGHSLRFARYPFDDYLFTASAPRDVTVLTGAVMMISRETFDALNGFDELLASYLQDVDLCLRALHSGFRIVFNPAARLIHMESITVQEIVNDASVHANRVREHGYFMRRWGDALSGDAFHNPLFDPADETMRTLQARPAGH